MLRKERKNQKLTTERKIWEYLYNEFKNRYAVAGIMGNLMAESAFLPNNVQNSFEKKVGSDEVYTAGVDNGTISREQFAHDGAGYGLAQWTYWSRKAKLWDYAKSCNMSIGGLFMQLGFLVEELKAYRLFDTLENIGSVAQATRLIMTQYEKPADQSENAINRRVKMAEEILARNVHEEVQKETAGDIMLQAEKVKAELEKLEKMLEILL